MLSQKNFSINIQFEKYGHKCDLDNEESDIQMPMFSLSGNRFTRFKNKIRRMTMISELNPRALYYLKNQCLIIEERKKHLDYKCMLHPFSDLRRICLLICNQD